MSESKKLFWAKRILAMLLAADTTAGDAVQTGTENHPVADQTDDGTDQSNQTSAADAQQDGDDVQKQGETDVAAGEVKAAAAELGTSEFVDKFCELSADMGECEDQSGENRRRAQGDREVR